MPSVNLAGGICNKGLVLYYLMNGCLLNAEA